MTRRFALLTLVFAAPAKAETIYAADFQNGTTTGWGASGSGDVRLASYEKNISLRIGGGTHALTFVPVAGKRDAYVQVKIAALELGESDRCIADASRDDGLTWRPLLTIVKARADGVTLWGGGASIPGKAGRLAIRLSAIGGPAIGCWFDDIRVTAVTDTDVSAMRVALTAEAVLGGTDFARPVDLSAFAPTSDAVDSSLPIEGLLVLSGKPSGGGVLLIDQKADYRDGGPAFIDFPDLSIGVIRSGATLLPATRGLIPTDHPDWNWIVEPGRIWQESGDGGLVRAALPFAIQERNANCTHNGVLTFLVDSKGLVGKAAFEIASETCSYLRFDAWGFLAARFVPGKVVDADSVIAAHEAWLRARLPVKPLSALPAEQAALFADAAGPEPTVYGAVINGVHYRSDCVTRHGDYPACGVIDLPSYSTAKSIFGAVALMRLEKLHPGIAGSKVAALVPACTDWTDVTLENLADMTSGHYRSPEYEADEAAPDRLGFFAPTIHPARIAFACSHYPRKTSPGTRWVYRTSDTYILGAALSAAGNDHGELYDGIVRPLWNRLGLSATLSTTRRTIDAVRQPFVGYGLTYQPDDIVRIARWLAAGADGLLDARLLNAALQRDPLSPGLGAGFPGYRYRAGFWSRDIAPLLGCATPRWVPFMSGFGGISIVNLPDDMMFYSFGDSDHYDWGKAAVALKPSGDVCR